MLSQNCKYGMGLRNVTSRRRAALRARVRGGTGRRARPRTCVRVRAAEPAPPHITAERRFAGFPSSTLTYSVLDSQSRASPSLEQRLCFVVLIRQPSDAGDGRTRVRCSRSSLLSLERTSVHQHSFINLHVSTPHTTLLT